MSTQAVTILIPHYKTLELTKLCLRLLRKHTDLSQAKVIVIDNDSQDESSVYLRGVSWLQLIERKAIPNESAVEAHARALDLALAQVTTPYVLSIHTDTLVKRADWLPFLLSHIDANPQMAGVGSWKLENKPVWRQWLKAIEYYLQLAYYRATGRTNHSLAGVGKNYYYLRSHCALYRTDLLRSLNLHFADGDMVAGKAMHEALVQAGYSMKFLSSEQLIKYMDHINHATVILNQLSTRQKSMDKGLKRIQHSLKSMNAQLIMQDASLDR